jgi:hypothetical protein
VRAGLACPLIARRGDVDAYVADRCQALSPASRGRRLSALSSWYAYLISYGVAASNPVLAVDHDHSVTIGLTGAQAAAFMRAARGRRGPAALRDTALLGMFAELGLRVGEDRCYAELYPDVPGIEPATVDGAHAGLVDHQGRRPRYLVRVTEWRLLVWLTDLERKRRSPERERIAREYTQFGDEVPAEVLAIPDGQVSRYSAERCAGSAAAIERLCAYKGGGLGRGRRDAQPLPVSGGDEDGAAGAAHRRRPPARRQAHRRVPALVPRRRRAGRR